VLSLRAHLPLDELQGLLEATLVLYEDDAERINLDVCKAIWIYARIATTPEGQSRALGWIRRALPKARKWLAYVMYLQAQKIPIARVHLLKAHDLLEIHWLDDPQEARKYAAAVGSALGRANEGARGQAMLHRAMAGTQED
jgi:hypothetical protein